MSCCTVKLHHHPLPCAGFWFSSCRAVIGGGGQMNSCHQIWDPLTCELWLQCLCFGFSCWMTAMQVFVEAVRIKLLPFKQAINSMRFEICKITHQLPCDFFILIHVKSHLFDLICCIISVSVSVVSAHTSSPFLSLPFLPPLSYRSAHFNFIFLAIPRAWMKFCVLSWKLKQLI